MTNKNVVIVVGGQWGDEGKGKVIDAYLTKGYKLVCRYNGSHNAGHTVSHQGNTFILHLVPSGILHPDVTNVIGNGVYVDPFALFEEIDMLTSKGVDVSNLRLSTEAPVTTSYNYHIENLSPIAKRIGTTKKAVGPSVSLHRYRISPLVQDFFGSAEGLARRFEDIDQEFMVSSRLGYKIDALKEAERYMRVFERTTPYLANTVELVNRSIGEGKGVIGEGAQGTLLDIDHGTYPNVTSTNTTAAGAISGLGIPIGSIKEVVGVFKLGYMTRVGGGPFPTELGDAKITTGKKPMDALHRRNIAWFAERGIATDEQIGDFLREEGNEYGATTGRPRRTGWWDGVAARYAAEINGFDWVAFTKVDIPARLPEIKVCTSYKGPNRNTCLFDSKNLELYEPVYGKVFRDLWPVDIAGTREYDRLPERIKELVANAEETVGVPARIISTGKDRNDTIYRF